LGAILSGHDDIWDIAIGIERSDYSGGELQQGQFTQWCSRSMMEDGVRWGLDYAGILDGNGQCYYQLAAEKTEGCQDVSNGWVKGFNRDVCFDRGAFLQV